MGRAMAIATRARPQSLDVLTIALLESIWRLSLGPRVWYAVVFVEEWRVCVRVVKYECESDADRPFKWGCWRYKPPVMLNP